MTTRSPCCLYRLRGRWVSSTDDVASLICRNSGSLASRPCSRTMKPRVPTLPTPTTLRAKSTTSKRSSRAACRAAGSRGSRSAAWGSPAEPVGRVAQARARGRDDDRWQADDPVPAVDELTELGERLRAVAGVRLAAFLCTVLLELGLCWPLRFSSPSTSPRRPVGSPSGCRPRTGWRTRSPSCPASRTRPWPRGRRQPTTGRRARFRPGVPVVARRQDEARRHPLHVALERPGQRLVEVVEVEHQPALGGGEDAEVGQVGVTAQLDLEAGGRGVRGPPP